VPGRVSFTSFYPDLPAFPAYHGDVIGSLLAIVLTAGLGGEAVSHFEVEAAFEPPEAASPQGAVAVRFSPLDPDVRVNEFPPPRLELDSEQSLLVVSPSDSAEAPPPADPDHPKYLDLSEPVRFPVEWAGSGSPGAGAVAADVVFFYCSTREGWCRRGKTRVEFSVIR